MKAFITGAAGFIGSTLADRLLAAGHQITGYDNFSAGQREFVAHHLGNPAYRLVEADLLDEARLGEEVRGHDVVFHLAANADVRFGLDHPRRDLEQNTIATHNVLEAMRKAGVRRIAFSSTGSIYGEPSVFPTPETCPFPVQTSLYGASKLACEGLLSAYSAGYGFSAWIFRFVSILGERYTHGHVFDFVKQLRADPHQLRILGDGRQRKSYLYVQDCIDAMLLAIDRLPEGNHFFNLGTDEYLAVDDSVAVITRTMGVQPKLHHSGGTRGWVGDSPFIFLDCSKMRSLGWAPRLRIPEAVERTTRYLLGNPALFDRRS
jgi:UDP-glucose 4-epimerase